VLAVMGLVDLDLCRTQRSIFGGYGVSFHGPAARHSVEFARYGWQTLCLLGGVERSGAEIEGGAQRISGQNWIVNLKRQ
jgi:hypothetical protein